MQIFVYFVVYLLIVGNDLGATTQLNGQINRQHRGVNRTVTQGGNHGGVFTRNDQFEEVMEKISSVASKQMEKLDSLDAQIYQMEAKSSQSLASMHSDLRRINSNTDQTDGKLDMLRTEIDRMARNVENNGHRLAQRQAPPPSSSTGTETSTDLAGGTDNKLEAIAILLQSTRLAISNAESTLTRLAANVTNLLQLSSEIKQSQQNQITKQFLHNALQSPSSSSKNQQITYKFVTPSTNSLNNPELSLIPISCAHLDEFSSNESGIKKIRINLTQPPSYVWCDMEEQNGGWTVIQRRIDGTINFNRNWLEYEFGFGNIAGEYFIGLRKLNAITTTLLHELLIVMEDFNGTSRYAKYSSFAIGGEQEQYALNVLGSYEGTAGDGLSYSAGHKFSTFDNDNDGWVEGNCAQAHTGAWWYNACEMSNLNGKYLRGDVSAGNLFQGMYWNDFHGPIYSLKSVKMLIRPIDRIFNPDMTVRF